MVIDSLTSSLSIIVNTVHLLIIIKYSNPNNNRTAIINLSILDEIRALLGLVLSNCPAQTLLYRVPALCTFTTIVTDLTIAVTLINLSLAALDRYIAVCNPFNYLTHRLTTNYNKIIIATWVVMSVYIAFQNSILDSCVIGSKMCGVFSTKPLYLLYLSLAFFLCGCSLTIVSVCFIKIILEFYKMAKCHRNESRVSLRMSLLLGLITALFYVSYLPLVFGIIAAISGEVLGNKTWSYLYTLIMLNGVFNTIVYGWLKKKYRYHLKRLFCNHKGSVCPGSDGSNTAHAASNAEATSDKSKPKLLSGTLKI